MIVVSYDSEILGKGEHWRGSESEVGQIPNIPAREMAKRTAQDGRTRSFGMWRVEQVESSCRDAT